MFNTPGNGSIGQRILSFNPQKYKLSYWRFFHAQIWPSNSAKMPLFDNYNLIYQILAFWQNFRVAVYLELIFKILVYIKMGVGKWIIKLASPYKKLVSIWTYKNLQLLTFWGPELKNSLTSASISWGVEHN